MKKLLLAIFIFISIQSFGQICTADTNFSGGYISPTRLPNAVVGSPYELTISFKVPKDTSLLYQGTLYNGRIDSAQVVYMKNVPAGFNYKCNISSCTWKGGSYGCALLKGTPDSSNLNKYTITVYVQTWVTVLQFGIQINRIDSSTIDLNINGGQASVAEKMNINNFSIYPNPVNSNLFVKIPLNFRGKISIIDIEGRTKIQQVINQNQDQISCENLPDGIYFLSIENDNNIGVTSRKKFIVKH